MTQDTTVTKRTGRFGRLGAILGAASVAAVAVLGVAPPAHAGGGAPCSNFGCMHDQVASWIDGASGGGGMMESIE